MDTSYHQQLLEHTGKRIRFYRRLKKLSQDELATAIHKSESTLSKYERGTIAIDIATLCDIAQVLDVSISDLVDIPKPATLTKSENLGLFGGKEDLYIYYYNKLSKRFEVGLIHMLQSQSSVDKGLIPCHCYLDIPYSGEYDDCTYFCTGNIDHYDTISFLDMDNATMKMDRMRLYIFNPYGRSTKTWGFFTGMAYCTSSIYIYKTLISAAPIPIGDLVPADFAYTTEEIKQLKSQHMIRYDPIEKAGT